MLISINFKAVNRFLFFVLSLILAFPAFSQDVQITTGPEEIGENQTWTITITVKNDRLKTYDKFPEIKGLRRRGTSMHNSTSVINGQVSSTQSIIMNYTPEKQGTIQVPAFRMQVNGKEYSVAAKKIKVGPAVQQRDPFSAFFDRQNDGFRQETEYIDLKADAFLDLTTDKKEIYRGEGVNVMLAFYVAESNEAPMNFYKISEQLSDILKVLKPANCWEENFNLETIQSESIEIKGKRYQRFIMYQATFFPFKAEPIRFPSVELEMIQYKVAKNPSFYGQNKKEDFKKFASREKIIRVKELPPHPLREKVSIGSFELEERIPSTALETAKSTTYEFTVRGEGNISAITAPVVPVQSEIEFYDPSTQQEVITDRGLVTGSKSFKYFIIPQQPGTFPLSKYIHWVYFDPRKNRYDSLKPRVALTVTGDSKTDHSISSNDAGGFYDEYADADNNLRRIHSGPSTWVLHGLAGLLFLTGIVFLVRRPSGASKKGTRKQV